MKNPYQIIKRQHITEKSRMLQELKNNESNKSVRRCKQPKYVFIVDKEANKREIANALEQIYEENKIKVVAVNTVNIKGKQRRVRGREGTSASYKKAVVTLEEGDSLDNV